MKLLKLINLIFIFVMGLISFSLNRTNLLLSLLSLEFMVLGLFLMLNFFLSIQYYDLYYLLMFLVFSVCEGALGLASLVSLVRVHGNDYSSSLSVSLW
uniref:NADH-ubiquinone oxidoreductase chain 4L n=1 Tax=Aradacanthia heissi TaxID=928818 RepID=I6LNM4_9HEMI|nr:NADH dehydrogenase subunit 4L [Aradacanthia heissi]